jgi:hypothetical protein
MTTQRKTIPEDVSINRLIRLVIKRINKKWEQAPIFFDQEDYRALNEAYWRYYKHKMLSIELSEEQTTALVKKRKEECRGHPGTDVIRASLPV